MKNIFFTLLAFLVLTAVSCSSGDDGGVDRATVELNVIGLESLSEFFEYEAWIVSGGEHISLGRFTNVDFPKTFTALSGDVANATQFKISIEQGNDPSPSISQSVLIAGNFSGNAATLSIDNAIGSFQNISGSFVLQTPTDNEGGVNNDNDESGIYFFNPNTGQAGLNLPTLPEGWKYNGWVNINATGGSVDLATGVFDNPAERDEEAPYSKQISPAPNYPGEDFLNGNVAPAGVALPTDLRGRDVFISLEPDLDSGRAPFFLQPLRGKAGQETSPELNVMTVNSASFPTGRVTRE